MVWQYSSSTVLAPGTRLNSSSKIPCMALASSAPTPFALLVQ